MKAAYADPPYLGCAGRLYGDPTYDSADAHRDLIDSLSEDFDAWAYSLNATTLRTILPMCPEDVRVMAWVKPFASFKPGVGVAYAWEPVIVRGGRTRDRHQLTVRDWTACNITLRRGVAGAKPDGFCLWLFEVLNLYPDDEFHDLFPGSGAVSRAWESWKRQQNIWKASEAERSCPDCGADLNVQGNLWRDDEDVHTSDRCLRRQLVEIVEGVDE